MNHESLSKKDLLEAYHQLDENHPHHLLPLETKLPSQLGWRSRDEYRIVMTMILSQRIDDYSLSITLGRFLSAYPTMESLRGLTSWSDAKYLLRGCGFKVDGPAVYNVDRFWSLVDLCLVGRSSRIGSDYLDTLEVKRGYGPKFTRTLRAYHLGDPSVLPLDGRGFQTLTKLGLYAHDDSINWVRTDIEHKLSGEMSIELIDFHELLRFRGQTDGKEAGSRQLEEIIVGWNAW